MKRFTDLIAACLPQVKELFPWDLAERLADQSDSPPLLLDIREPSEYAAFHLPGSLNVPRGILESACDYGYEDTVPSLVAAREQEIIVICRSGNRSVLAAHTMQLMGYSRVFSLKTGIRGWNDYEQPLQDAQGATVDADAADVALSVKPTPEQLGPRE